MLFPEKKGRAAEQAARLILRKIAGRDLSKDLRTEILTIINDDVIRCCGISLYSYDDDGGLALFASTCDDAEWLSAQKAGLEESRLKMFEYGSKGRLETLLREGYISTNRVPCILELEEGDYNYGYLVCDSLAGESEAVSERLKRFEDASMPENLLRSAVCIMVRQGSFMEKVAGEDSPGRKALIERMRRLGSCILVEVGICSDEEIGQGRSAAVRNRYFTGMKSLLPNGWELYLLDGCVAAVFEKNGTGPSLKEKLIANIQALYAGKKYRPYITECDVADGLGLLAIYACEMKRDTAIPGKLYSLYYSLPERGYAEVTNVDFGEEGADDNIPETPECEIVEPGYDPVPEESTREAQGVPGNAQEEAEAEAGGDAQADGRAVPDTEPIKEEPKEKRKRARKARREENEEDIRKIL